MAEEKSTDLEKFEILGYEIGQAFAAYMRGAISGFSDFSALAPAPGKTPDSRPVMNGKQLNKDYKDCEACLCNTCANLDSCTSIRVGYVQGCIRPNPCIGCADGMRFSPVEPLRCGKYKDKA